MKRRIICLLLCACISVMLAGCGGSGDATGKLMSYSLTDDPQSLDPQVASDYNSMLVIQNVYEGLLTKEEDGKLSEGVATSYDVSDDKMTYTFHLRSDAKWMHRYKNDPEDGTESYNTPVTAYDFQFAFRRLLNPNTNSPFAANFYCIKNAKAVHENGLSIDQLGVVAENDTTLTVYLEAPNAMFLELMTTTPAMPCNETFFNETKGRYGLDLEHILSNGPFYMKEWSVEHYVRIRQNPVYQSALPTVASGANLTIRTSEEALEALNSDTIDIGILTAKEYSQLSSKDFVSKDFENTVWGLAFNTERPEWSNQDIRMAFMMSIDRSQYESYLPESTVNTNAVVPSSVKILDQSYRDLPESTIPNYYNVEQARQHLQNGLAQLNLSDINQKELIVPEEVETLVQQISQQWQSNLGVYFKITGLSDKEYQQALKTKNYDCALISITNTGSSPEDILSQFLDGEQVQNSSPAFVQAMNQAESAVSVDDMISACQQAEQILLSDSVFLPLYFQKEYFVTRTGVDHLVFDSAGRLIQFKYATKQK